MNKLKIPPVSEDGLDRIEEIDEVENTELRLTMEETEMELVPVESDSESEDEDMAVTFEQKKQEQEKQRAMQLITKEGFHCVTCNTNIGTDTLTLLSCGDQACITCAQQAIDDKVFFGTEFKCPACGEEVETFTKMKKRSGTLKEINIVCVKVNWPDQICFCIPCGRVLVFNSNENSWNVTLRGEIGEFKTQECLLFKVEH